MNTFKLGMVVNTSGIFDRRSKDADFSVFVHESLGKFETCDWGDLNEHDRKLNDEAVRRGDLRIRAVYRYPKTGERIWIVTEADHSMTTILFPHEN